MTNWWSDKEGFHSGSLEDHCLLPYTEKTARLLWMTERKSHGLLSKTIPQVHLFVCLCTDDVIVSNKEALSSPRLSHAEEATRADISFWIFIYLWDHRRAFIVLQRQGPSWGLFVCLSALKLTEVTLSVQALLCCCCSCRLCQYMPFYSSAC